jgi:hypothetical protein
MKVINAAQSTVDRTPVSVGVREGRGVTISAYPQYEEPHAPPSHPPHHTTASPQKNFKQAKNSGVTPEASLQIALLQ